MQIDARSEIYVMLNFLKNVCGSSDFHKNIAMVLKLYTNMIYQSRTFGIELGQNR